MIEKIKNTKQLKLLINKLDKNDNRRFETDILRIFLINDKHEKIVLNVLNNVGLKNSSNKKFNILISELKNKNNTHCESDGSRIFYKSISIGCRHCVKDLGCTVRMTTQCNRNCFFCFAADNPIDNKTGVDLNYLKRNVKDRQKEVNFLSCAISGGEPFLFPNQVFNLLRFLNKNYPNTYKRIYTNGDFVNEVLLKKLKANNLDEIRYSIKPGEKPNASLLKLSKKYIPIVMVEMPILPGIESRKEMISLIKELDLIGVNGINLLELFFNGFNVKAFKDKGYKIDLSDGVRKIYDSKPIYEYPIYGSQENCLKLIKYFSEYKANLFINYCSHRTKQLQYNEKNKRLAKTKKIGYFYTTNEGLHKILCIYENIEAAEKLLKSKKLIFSVKNDERYGQRLETSIDNYKLFKNKNHLSVFIYRDPSDLYDVDFDLTN
jgi:pyruvate formate-lyase activating enzyme-like uncharacterized protein